MLLTSSSRIVVTISILDPKKALSRTRLMRAFSRVDIYLYGHFDQISALYYLAGGRVKRPERLD